MYGHDNMECRIRTHLKRGSLQFQLCIIQQWYKWTIKEEDTNQIKWSSKYLEELFATPMLKGSRPNG
jgi:hypothetical protein